MRLRALFVSVIALVTAVVMVVPAFAGSDHGHRDRKHDDTQHHKHHRDHSKQHHKRYGKGDRNRTETGPIDISGVTDADADDTTALRYVGDPAPGGFAHGYQWARPSIETSPADGPVTFTSTLDVGDRVPNTVDTIGLVELSALEDGGDARDTGA